MTPDLLISAAGKLWLLRKVYLSEKSRKKLMWKQIQSRNSAWLHSAFSLTSRMASLNLSHLMAGLHSQAGTYINNPKRCSHMRKELALSSRRSGGVACDREKQPAWHFSPGRFDFSIPMSWEMNSKKNPQVLPSVLLANPGLPANNSRLLSHYYAREEPDVTILLFILSFLWFSWDPGWPGTVILLPQLLARPTC